MIHKNIQALQQLKKLLRVILNLVFCRQIYIIDDNLIHFLPNIILLLLTKVCNFTVFNKILNYQII